MLELYAWDSAQRGIPGVFSQDFKFSKKRKLNVRLVKAAFSKGFKG